MAATRQEDRLKNPPDIGFLKYPKSSINDRKAMILYFLVFIMYPVHKQNHPDKTPTVSLRSAEGLF